MKAPIQARGKSLDLQLTTLIDVVFLLLIFFVWTSSFKKPEFDLPSEVSLPATASVSTQSTSPMPLFDEIEIMLGPTIGDSLSIRLNRSQVTDLAQLQAELTKINRLGVQPPIVIQPDPRTQMHHAIAVYDCARLAGFDQVLFAVKP